MHRTYNVAVNNALTFNVAVNNAPQYNVAVNNALTFNVAVNNALYISLHIKCLIFLPDINQISVILPVPIAVPNIKFHTKLPTVSHGDTCGQTD